MTHAALHCLLLQTTTGDPQEGMSDDTYDEDRDDLLTELIDEEVADDTRELQEPYATTNSPFFTLQEEYNDLLVTDTTMKDIKSSQYLHTLQDHINHVKENQIWSRTGRPWLMLMQIVAIIRMFILEWTTSLDSSSGTLICSALCPRHVGRNNYVPLFGVDPIEWRLTHHYVIRDVIVIFEC